MNYSDPQLRVRLAADYIAGYMRGAARRRFESLMGADANLRRMVRDWEDDIYPLVMALPPVKPRRRVWRTIRARLQPASEGLGWHGLIFWRSLSGALAVVLVAALVVFPRLPGPGSQQAMALQAMAVLQTPQNVAMVVVRADAAGQLHVYALQNLASHAVGKSLQLWAIQPGQLPQSIGLVLPNGLTSLQRPSGLNGVAQLAVSVEPEGGSPTGKPTGPIIMSGDVLAV